MYNEARPMCVSNVRWLKGKVMIKEMENEIKFIAVLAAWEVSFHEILSQ